MSIAGHTGERKIFCFSPPILFFTARYNPAHTPYSCNSVKNHIKDRSKRFRGGTNRRAGTHLLGKFLYFSLGEGAGSMCQRTLFISDLFATTSMSIGVSVQQLQTVYRWLRLGCNFFIFFILPQVRLFIQDLYHPFCDPMFLLRFLPPIVCTDEVFLPHIRIILSNRASLLTAN